MTVRVDQRQLRAAMSRLKSVTACSPAVPIEVGWDGDLGRLTFAGVTTDSQMRVDTWADVDSEDDGGAGFPFRTYPGSILRLLGMVGRRDAITVRMDGPEDRDKEPSVRFEVDRLVLTARCVADGDTARGKPKAAFTLPEPSRPDPLHVFRAPARMIEAWRTVSKAASNDWARPVLTRVDVTTDGVAAATDSYRLISRKFDDAPDVPLRIPRRMLEAIPKCDEVLISHMDPALVNWQEFACDDGTTITWLNSWALTGEFPNWRALVPTESMLRVWIEVDRDEAIRVAANAAAVSDFEPVRMAWDRDAGEFDTLVQVQDSCTLNQPLAGMAAKDDVGRMTIAFNPVYLLEGLRSVPTPRVRLGIIDALKPAMISDPEYAQHYLLMPVRV